MEIIKAKMTDLDEILSIYEYARSFMAAHGNPNQWKKTNPTRETVINDIECEKLHLCVYHREKRVKKFFEKFFKNLLTRASGCDIIDELPQNGS